MASSGFTNIRHDYQLKRANIAKPGFVHSAFTDKEFVTAKPS